MTEWGRKRDREGSGARPKGIASSAHRRLLAMTEGCGEGGGGGGEHFLLLQGQKIELEK